MTNNDEIVCEVVEWDTEDNASIVMRSPLKLIQGEDEERGLRFYAFRPWMGFQENPFELQILNAGHIIAEAKPSESLLKHYASTITEQLNNRQPKTDLPLDEIYGLDDEELEEYIAEYQETRNEEILVDSSESNIIEFPKTLH